MFSQTAQWYDKIYQSMKDYGAEADTLMGIIRAYRRSPGNRLLDIACGTGLHLSYLKEHFYVEGLDLDEHLLAIARHRLPEVPLHHADMTDFTLGRRFDVVTCLFSAIGYVKTLDHLAHAIQCMASHLSPGGVLLIEPCSPRTYGGQEPFMRTTSMSLISKLCGSTPVPSRDDSPSWTCIT
jgi:SAM-dependent methyltransferase